MFDTLRRRRAALVPDVVADPARRRLRRRPRPASATGAPGAAAALERVVLPHAVRQRRRAHGAASCAPTRPTARPLHPGQDPRAGRRRDRQRSTPTTCSAPAQHVRVVPRRAHQLVHPPQPRPVLGRATHDAFDTLHTVLDVLCRVAAPLLPLVTEEIYRRACTGRRGRQRAPDRLADAPTSCPPTTSWSRRWTWSARCARPRCRCARRSGLRVRLPLRRADRRRAGRRAACAPFVDLIADEVNVKGRAHRRRRRGRRPWCCRSCRRRSARGSAATCSR